MIELEQADEGVVFTGSPGMVSFIDRDWMPEGRTGPVPALSFSRSGEVSWEGRVVGSVEAGADERIVAARAILAVARDAAAAVSGRPHGRVEVVGEGLVASAARRLTSGGTEPVAGRPTAVIEGTGDLARIRSALDLVDDLGVVVLAGEAAGRTLEVDLYTTVHRRGLVVVGARGPILAEEAPPERVSPDLGGELGWCLDALVDVRLGAPVPNAGLWFRVAA